MKALTPKRMESGKKFVALLDEKGRTPKAAFWIYNSDLDDWHLLVGHVEGIGDNEAAFNEAVSVLLETYASALPELAVRDVVLALGNAPILEYLNALVNTGDEILGINFTNEEINGKIIDGVYLYRMNITELV